MLIKAVSKIRKNTKKSGKKKHNKNHISNKEWKALSQTEKDRIKKSREQGLAGHPNMNKTVVSNVDTAEEGEVEDPPPMVGPNLGKRYISRKRRRYDMNAVIIVLTV